MPEPSLTTIEAAVNAAAAAASAAANAAASAVHAAKAEAMGLKIEISLLRADVGDGLKRLSALQRAVDSLKAKVAVVSALVGSIVATLLHKALS